MMSNSRTTRTALALNLLIFVCAQLGQGAESFSNVRETSNYILRSRTKDAVTTTANLSSPNPRTLTQPLHAGRDNDLEETSNAENMTSLPIENAEILDEEETTKTTAKGFDRSARTKITLTTLVSSLSGVAIAAKAGVLRGPFDAAAGTFGMYSDAMILRDAGSAVTSAALAYIVIGLNTKGYVEGWYNSKVSRKLTHVFVAPLYMIIWPIFSAADGARFFAVVVSLVNALRLYLAATGSDYSTLAQSVSRSGDKAEALQGPFIYVCITSAFILGFWRSSVIGIVALCTMAAGDGMADLVGRRWGGNSKWWFSDTKSMVGTAAFAVSASAVSYGILTWLEFTGCLKLALDPMDLAVRIIGISVACALVELLPVGDDNFTVPLSAAVLAALLLQ